VQGPPLEDREKGLGKARDRRPLESSAARIDQDDATPTVPEKVFRHSAELIEDVRERTTSRDHLQEPFLTRSGVDEPAAEPFVHRHLLPATDELYAPRVASSMILWCRNR
jgi:hypothetical protein